MVFRENFVQKENEKVSFNNLKKTINFVTFNLIGWKIFPLKKKNILTEYTQNLDPTFRP